MKLMIQLASDPRFAHGLVISWAGPGVLAKLLYANNKARFSRNSNGGGTFVISMMLNPVRCGSKGFIFDCTNSLLISPSLSRIFSATKRGCRSWLFFLFLSFSQIMQSFIGGSIRLGRRQGFYSWSNAYSEATTTAYLATNSRSTILYGPRNSTKSSKNHLLQSLRTMFGCQTNELAFRGSSGGCPIPSLSPLAALVSTCTRCMTTDASPGTMYLQILDKEAVEEVKGQREVPDIKPGYIVQLKVEVPENKRRLSTIKGIVIARRNAGLNTTFRIRRMVAGVGVESLFPLYSPNIKEIKVLDKKKVRRAKLYYLRNKMNALR
ncbi:hypothetical protein GQ457_17G017780 [Hibiscus cannabinus]